MAKGKKTGGKDFEPGQSGNPSGRPKLPLDLQQARKLNSSEFERLLNKFLYLTKNEILKICQDERTPIIEILIGSIVIKAIENGDQTRLAFILERLLGKPKDKLTLEHSGTLNSQIEFSDDQLKRMAEEFLAS